MFRLFACSIVLSIMIAGCAAPKPVKLDGSDRVPVNKPDISKAKEGGTKK